jgi:rhodanese-related sulfurtransferase
LKKGRILGCERAYARSHPKIRFSSTGFPKEQKIGVINHLSHALDAHLTNLPEAGFGSVKAPDFNTEIASGVVPFILDVRSQAEWDADGHIDGSVLVPITDLPANLDQLPIDKADSIVTTCKSGHRGAIAQMYLQFLGYTNVRNLNGGLNAWIGAELPVVK